MEIYKIYKHFGLEVIDYQSLVSYLQDYANPRAKISAWLLKKDLIRIKKGLYVFGKEVATKPFVPEHLANLIYGPSAISLQSALAFYGLIPEKVYTLTSITNKRRKFFQTPIGDFNYIYLHPEKYSLGIQLKEAAPSQNILIATPEKALCDIIYQSVKPVEIHHTDDVKIFLENDLRIEDVKAKLFDLEQLEEIANTYQFEPLSQFVIYYSRWVR